MLPSALEQYLILKGASKEYAAQICGISVKEFSNLLDGSITADEATAARIQAALDFTDATDYSGVLGEYVSLLRANGFKVIWGKSEGGVKLECETNRADFFTETDRLHSLLGPQWFVECSYSPNDAFCVIYAALNEVA